MTKRNAEKHEVICDNQINFFADRLGGTIGSFFVDQIPKQFLFSEIALSA